MSTDDFSKNSDTNIDSQRPKSSSNNSGKNMDTTDTRKIEANDAKFENTLNEVIEYTSNDSSTYGNRTAPPVEDGSNNRKDIFSVKNEKESDEEKKDIKNKSKKDVSPDKDGPSAETTDEEEKKMMIIRNATIAGAATLGAIIGPFAIVGVLGAVGFGAAGVAAGSVAAAIQSSVYGGAVASGSIFAACQSIGAAGLGIAGTTASVVGGGGISAGIGAALNTLFNKTNEEKPNNTGNTSDVKTTANIAEENCGNSSNNTKCNKKTQTAAVNEISENGSTSDTTGTEDESLLKEALEAEMKPSPDSQITIDPENNTKDSTSE